MKTSWIVVLVTMTAWVGIAKDEGEMLRRYTWEAVNPDLLPPEAQVAPGGSEVDGAVLHIENTSGSAVTVPILSVVPPRIDKRTYALMGQVAYRNVEEKGYLEMWSTLHGARFFSRTLSASGPVGVLSGSSEWRNFALPFHMQEELIAPELLEVNVVLPAGGTVLVGPMTLKQFDDRAGPYREAGAWWDDETAGLIGGIGGGLFGAIGAMIGILLSRGLGRSLVFGLLWLMVVTGAVFLVGGIVAFLASQPYAVMYPLLLFGVLLLILPLGLLKTVRTRYRNVELRRMQALDAEG